MPIQRIPLVEPITSRDGEITKDSKLVNVTVETVVGNNQKNVVITRPAMSYLFTLEGLA
jgi:hypothetical protein